MENKQNIFEKHGVERHPELSRGYLSVSQIEKLHRCAKQYHYHYIENRSTFDGSPEIHYGSAVHAAIEKTHLQQIAGEEISHEDSLAQAEAVLLAQFMEGRWDVETFEDLQGSVMHGVRASYHSWWKEFGAKIVPESTEKEFLKEIRGIPVLGYIDLLYRKEDGTRVVCDYKTSGRAKTQAFVDENLQLWTYALVEGISDVQIVTLVRPKGNMLKYDKDCIATTKVVSSVVTSEKKFHTERIIADAANLLSAGVFPRCAPGGWHCSEKYCEFFEMCRGKDAEDV